MGSPTMHVTKEEYKAALTGAGIIAREALATAGCLDRRGNMDHPLADALERILELSGVPWDRDMEAVMQAMDGKG